MREAVYTTKDAARAVLKYITGPQIEHVGVLRKEFEQYVPLILWKDGTETTVKVWQAEWFSLNKEN